MAFIGQTPAAVITGNGILDGTVTAADLHTTLDLSTKTITYPSNSVTAAALHTTLDLSGKTITYGNLPAANLTGTLPAIDGSALTGIESLPTAISVDSSAPDNSLNINSTGNVGIGTSSLTTGKFVVNPNATGLPPVSISQTGDNPYLEIQRWTGSGSDYVASRIQQHSSAGLGRLAFYTATLDEIGSQTFTEQMCIRDSGNVGINTTNPSAKLDVNGTINATQFEGKTRGNIIGYDAQAVNTPTSWVTIGTFAAAQTGQTCRVQIYYHAGYNADNGQDALVDIFFKTSNNASVNSTGFAGNSWFTNTGSQRYVANTGVKWVANAAGIGATEYTLYVAFPNYTLNSHYTVSYSDGSTWTDSPSLTSDPGSASSTVLVSSILGSMPYAQGNAPVYGCRAWVTYNAQTNTILEDGNVSSVTDHATGQFTVNFSTAMPDVNYAACGIVGQNDGTTGNHILCEYSPSRTTSSARVVSGTAGNTETDEPYWTYSVFR
jgi:hypothetical protein